MTFHEVWCTAWAPCHNTSLSEPPKTKPSEAIVDIVAETRADDLRLSGSISTCEGKLIRVVTESGQSFRGYPRQVLNFTYGKSGQQLMLIMSQAGSSEMVGVQVGRIVRLYVGSNWGA